jgi:hypothetical protein
MRLLGLAAGILALNSPADAQNGTGDVTRLRVAPQGNEVRYRVRSSF